MKTDRLTNDNPGPILCWRQVTGMEETYMTLEKEAVPLADLAAEERRFLGEMVARIKGRVSYLDFSNFFMEPYSRVLMQSERLGVPAEETTLYKVWNDMGKRLGIEQGYLVRHEIVKGEGIPRKELTTGEVAKLAGCTHEAVRKALRTWRLRGRRVGRMSLVWDKDAEAFAKTVRERKRAAGMG